MPLCRAAFHNQPGTLDSGHDWRDVSGRLLVGCLFLSLGSLLQRSARPDGGGDDPFRARRKFVFHSESWLKRFSAAAQWKRTVLSHFALFQQMKRFARGVVTLATVIFYLSLTLFFCFNPARGGKPALEIKWQPIQKTNPVSRQAAEENRLQRGCRTILCGGCGDANYLGGLFPGALLS